MYAEMFDASNPVALLSWNPGLRHGEYSGPTYPFDKSSEGKSHHFLGFEFWRLDSSYPHLDRHFKSVTFPHALLVILLALYPLAGAWKIIRIIRTYRKRPPLRFAICPKCGYDIRFCHDKCPECGASIESSLPDSPPHSTDHL